MKQDYTNSVPEASQRSLCQGCQNPVSTSAWFCVSCGLRLNGVAEDLNAGDQTPSCWNCGRRITEWSKFCPDCGSQLGPPPVSREKSPLTETATDSTPMSVDADDFIGVKLPSAPVSVVPREVKIAVRLIFISLAVALLATVLLWDSISALAYQLENGHNALLRNVFRPDQFPDAAGSSPAIVLSILVGLGISFGLGMMIRNRANWARICFLLQYAGSIVLGLVGFRALRENGLLTLTKSLVLFSLIQYALQGCASYFLLQPASVLWFNSGRRRNRGTTPGALIVGGGLCFILGLNFVGSFNPSERLLGLVLLMCGCAMLIKGINALARK
jgi:hypothetical protein